MAIEHIVKLKTNKSLHHVVEQWLKNMNTDAVIKAGTKPNILYVNHPYFHLTAFKHQDEHPITIKAVGFDPTVSLGFRLLPNGKNHQSALEVIKKQLLCG